MTLWEKHEVMSLGCGAELPSLRFAAGFETPVTASLIVNWRDAKGDPFPERDLTPRRVGVLRYNEVFHPLFCAPISWAQLTLMSKAETRDEIPEDERFHALAVSCLVRTADERFVVTFRSEKVSTYPNMWHVSAAGYVDLSYARDTQSLLVQVFRELEEETGLFPSDLTRIRHLGVCKHLPRDSAHIEPCFLAETSLPAHEVLERSRHAKDAWEGKYSAFTEAEVLRILETDRWTPAGAATLLLLFGM